MQLTKLLLRFCLSGKKLWRPVSRTPAGRCSAANVELERCGTTQLVLDTVNDRVYQLPKRRLPKPAPAQ